MTATVHLSLDGSIDPLYHNGNSNELSVDIPTGSGCESGSDLLRSPNRSSLVKQGSKKYGTTKKAVSFGTMPTDKRISNVGDCLLHMQQGCDMVKVRSNSRRYRRHFVLDEDCQHLRWTPTSKKPHKAKIIVDSIKEVRMGKNTDILRNAEAPLDDFADDCAFSIIWGDTFESLDLVACSPDEANIWVTGLTALVSGAYSQISTTKEAARCIRDKWLEENFRAANGTKPSVFLDLEDASRLFRKLNHRIPAARVAQKFKELECSRTQSDASPKGKISCEEFCEIFKELCTRPEIYFLMVRYANKEYLSCEDLLLFLETEQGLTGVSKDMCNALIAKYEPSPEAVASDLMTVDGFTNYLLSDECDIFDFTHRTVCQDMTQPLNHYFISASNNTYLTEDQLKGSSCVEGYTRALSRGCRFIEIDVWEVESTPEPVIYHGHTLTSKLPVSKALKAIKEYAFDKSQFPLIIQLETHLSVQNQRWLAALIRSTFGTSLYADPIDPDLLTLPTPAELTGRIIFKGKKLALDMAEDEGEVTEEDESYEAMNKSSKTHKSSICQKRQVLCKELSDLCCLESTRFHDLENLLKSQLPGQVCSMNESLASRLMCSCSESFVAYNKKFLTRVYPNGVRVDSSNFNPQDLWNCGCQLVCMNFQTPGLMMDLVYGKFTANGGCGYVLKPAFLRDECCFSIPSVTPQVLHLKVISGQQLPRPRGSTAKGESCDPYVILEVFGIPGDCAEERTKTVRNDSYSPMFDESFEFHVTMPELALVRFLVLDDDYIQDDFIGQFTIPFDCLQSGYRHVPLFASDGERIENASLFVHIAITNRRGGGKASKRGMSVRKKKLKVQTGIKLLGIKQLDDSFKVAIPFVVECIQIKGALESALIEFQESCGLGATANLKQILRQLISRWQTACLSSQATTGTTSETDTEPVPEPKLLVNFHNEIPELETSVPISELLKKSFVCFDKVVARCRSCLEKCDSLEHKLEEISRRVLESYDDLSALCMQAGLKGQKASRASENFGWNIRLIKGQVDAMKKLHQEASDLLQQIRDCAVAASVLKECDVENCTHSGHISVQTSACSPVAAQNSPHPTLRQQHLASVE